MPKAACTLDKSNNTYIIQLLMVEIHSTIESRIHRLEMVRTSLWHDDMSISSQRPSHIGLHAMSLSIPTQTGVPQLTSHEGSPQPAVRGQRQGLLCGV